MGSGRRLKLRAIAPVTVAVLLGTALQSRPEPVRAVVAQTPPTTAPDLLRDLLNQLVPTTTAPPAAPAPAADPSAPAPGSPAASQPPAVPPLHPDSDGPRTLLVLPDFRPRAGARSNAPLLEALRQLEAVGFTEEEAMRTGMGHFPIAGPAYYTDGYLEPRPGHLHQGVDITAASGTPVRAPGDGVVQFSEEGGYGKVATVTVAGTSYFMAHLDGFAEEFSSGAPVKQGDIVGFVGSTGNSTGPHVHLEVRSSSGQSDPKPLLDRWLDEALAAIPGIVASVTGAGAGGPLPRALTDTGLLRRFDERPAGSAAALDALAWASTVSPGGPVVPLAERRVQEVAVVESDPDVLTLASADSWRRAERLARAVVTPLVPAGLQGLVTTGGD